MAIMQNEQLHLIKRLKRQSRLGADPNPFDAVSKALQGLFKGYEQGYQDVIRQDAFGYIAKQAQDAYDKVNILEERNDKLRKGFGASTAATARLGFQFDKLAQTLGVNAQKLKDYAVELNSILPGRAAFIGSIKDETTFTGKLAKTTEQYRNKLGIASDVVNKFYQNQTLMGKTAKAGFETSEAAILKIAKKYESQYQGVYTDLIEGLGSVDAEVAGTFGQMPEKLAEAVIKTKKLGIELSDVLSVGDSMLDIESAIGKEIELQILGADNLNVAAIQKARLDGDALAITEEIEKFVKANGEQFKENPFLLQSAADALGMQKAELLAMYSQMQLNEQVTAETEEEDEKRLASNQKLLEEYAKQNNKKIEELTLQDRAIALESKQTELDKQQDQAQQNLTDNILAQYKVTDPKQDPEALYQKQVTDLANNANKYSQQMIDASNSLVSALASSDLAKSAYAAGSIVKTVKDFFDVIQKGGEGSNNATALGDTKSGSDLFIPAGGANTVVSGPFGSFALDSRDDVLAAPNIREATNTRDDVLAASTIRGATDDVANVLAAPTIDVNSGIDAKAIASAVASALQGMSFQVTNVFDGDKIASRLQIRKGQAMNNLGNIA
jgi:hypothetical protein